MVDYFKSFSIKIGESSGVIDMLEEFSRVKNIHKKKIRTMNVDNSRILAAQKDLC